MRDLQLPIVAVKTEKRTLTAYLWLMFVICFIGNIMGGAVSTLMSVYLPVVARDLLGLAHDAELKRISALINAVYFVGWTFGGLTWGYIGDRLGRVASLSLAVGMFGIFALLTAWAGSWDQVVLFRFLSGFGVGGTLVVNTTLLSEVWPASSRAVFLGILSIGFPVGIISSGAVNYLIPGWRQGFLTGLVAVLDALCTGLFLKESEPWRSARRWGTQVRAKIDWKGHTHDLFKGSLVFGSMLIGLWAVFSWVPTWVQSILSGTGGQQERGLSMMVLGMGGLTGGFLSGWIANALGTRKAMLGSFLGCFVLSVLLFKGNTNFTALTITELAALAFMFGISQGLLSVYIPLLFPVSVRSGATGFCFNLGRFFTAAAVFFVGDLVISLGGYGNSLFAFSFIFLFGFLILMISKNLTKENYGTYTKYS